jgi:ABC-type multidrug transport system fused ATPase/permease subunit
MLQLPSKPPNLRKASSRNYRNLFITQPNLPRRNPEKDAIAQLRARRPEEDKRDSEKERESMLRFLAYLKPSIPYFVVASICGVTVYLVPQLTPICTGYIIDRIIGVGAQGATGKTNFLYAPIDTLLLHTAGLHASKLHRIQVLMGSLLAFIPFWATLIYLRAFMAGVGGQRVIFKLRNDLYNHIQTLSLSFFSSYRSGSIVSRLTSDVAQAQNFIGNACTNLWMDTLAIIILSFLLVKLDAHLALVAMAVLPIWVTSVRLFGQGIRRHSLFVQEGVSELSGQVQEKISAATVVQAFTREKHEMRSFFKLHHALMYRQLVVTRLNALNMTTANILTNAAPIAVALYGTSEVVEGRLSVGTLIMFFSMLNTFYNPLARITDLAAVIANSAASIERIFQILDIQPEICNAENAIALPERIEGKIELRNVSFGYGDEMILKNIDLKVEPGEVVAFVGPSGAGKSTLVSLIPRFYDVNEGAILVDGLNIAEATVKSLRNNIGMVLQDNILFTGSIQENILYGRPAANEEDIEDAAKAANAHDFIMDLSEGYETQIGERGTKLSGGQKQRIAITRAFLRDPRILILDEATSALDSESEKLIQSALNRLMVGRTTLIIAHRLSTILHADKIVVMQDGRIVEVGRHQELLANEGLYYHLFKAQFEHALSMDAGFFDQEASSVEAAPVQVEKKSEKRCDNHCGCDRLATAT